MIAWSAKETKHLIVEEMSVSMLEEVWRLRGEVGDGLLAWTGDARVMLRWCVRAPRVMRNIHVGIDCDERELSQSDLCDPEEVRGRGD